MNSIRPLIFGLTVAACSFTACTDRKAQQESEAKARADASRKEMEKLSETFKPRYNKKLTPDASASKDGTEKKAAEPPVK